MEKQGAMVHAREKPALEHADLPGIELFDFFQLAESLPKLLARCDYCAFKCIV